MTTDRPLDDVFSEICAAELPLRDRLAAFAAAIQTHAWGQPFAEAYQKLIDQLATAGAGGGAPRIGDALPNFILPDTRGGLVSFESLLGAGPIVVSFNRGHWCEFCELELRAFAEAQAAFARRGARVLSIMPERLAYLRCAEERTARAVTYLADIDNGYALQLGLAIWLGDDVKNLYTGAGLDLPSYQGNGMWFAPIPATFVCDPAGRIVARKVDPDFRMRMDVDDILASLPI